MDISGEILDGRRRKIDASTVKDHSKDLPNEYRVIDDANILETILLRQIPSERINGVLTLFFALRNGATNEEIENALVSVFFIYFHTVFNSNDKWGVSGIFGEIIQSFDSNKIRITMKIWISRSSSKTKSAEFELSFHPN